MHKFNFIEHTADIAVDLQATTLEELFICAAEAWSNTMLDTQILYDDETMRFDFEASSLEELIVNFLSEINFLFLSKKWFCNSVENVSLHQSDKSYHLSVRLAGLNVENSKIDFKEEIKAVTYHQLQIKKVDGSYTTRIVFDI